jgi:hypothetical protein
LIVVGKYLSGFSWVEVFEVVSWAGLFIDKFVLGNARGGLSRGELDWFDAKGKHALRRTAY